MRYVILRDDDTHALTPIECLEKLYRPFFERNLPVNLAVIPNVNTQIILPDGKLEYFLRFSSQIKQERISIGENKPLVEYLLKNKGYHFAQHGFDHMRFEFDSSDSSNIIFRLDEGRKILKEAGLRVNAFVAPYNKMSAVAYLEIAKRYPVISTSYFESRRLPFRWWPKYIYCKWTNRSHMKIKSTFLLSYPNLYLSAFKPFDSIWDNMKRAIDSQKLLVLTTHWWEYFLDRKPNQSMIDLLHKTADYLAHQPDIKVISFDDLVNDPSIFSDER